MEERTSSGSHLRMLTLLRSTDTIGEINKFMMHAEIYLIRHGETTWNAERRWQGQKDSPLSKSGVAQAESIGQRLATLDFTQIYASDLTRAYETASHIAGHHQLDVIKDVRLRERKGGVIEGLTVDEVEEQHPELAERMKGTWAPDFAPEGAESALVLRDRALPALTELAQKHMGERIAVVSHGGTMRVTLQHILGIPMERPFPLSIGNTSLNILRYGDFRGGSWRAITLGDMAHVQTQAE